MSKVVIKGIKKSFNNNEILKNIDLQIDNGEFIVVLGPSGCGKSTLLRVIAGLEKVSEGEIFIGDKNVSNLEPKDRSIAMVFQNYALYPHMTVYNNIAYGLKLHKVPKLEIEKKVNEAADMLHLKELLHRKPNQLSGGQRQRVAMGRAIVRSPSVFLFDEPLSNLDAKLRTQMRFEIKNIHKNIQTTSIYVTHDQIEAMTLADRIVLLNKGKIEQIGKPLEIYDKPLSNFVGGFIGNPPMNFLPADYMKKYINIEFPANDLLLGVRPEKIKVIENHMHSEENLIPLNVEMIESIGHEMLVYGKIDGTNLDLVLKGIDIKIDSQKKLFIQISLHDIHYFNSNSGKRIN